MTDHSSTLHRADVLSILHQRGITPDHLNAIADDRWEATFVNPGGTLDSVLDAQMERLDADPFVLMDIRHGKHAWWVTFQEVER